jgi:flagellar protein FliO/FliZ
MEELGFQDYLRFLFALVLVLGVFGLLVLIARRYGLGQRMPIRTGRDKRLQLIEVMALDSKRRLALIGRDDTEHLVILGAEGETVVETGIKSGSPGSFRHMVENARQSGDSPANEDEGGTTP